MNTPLKKSLFSWFHEPTVPIKVYLAGKIRKHCWRHRLINGLRDHHWALGPLTQNRFVYVGPFFVGCDHGCYHQPNSHGNVIGCWPDRDLSQIEVTQQCLTAIDSADLFFCYIDSLDCYGTLVEIGYAHARGIRIVIAFAPNIASPTKNDMWFPTKFARNTHYNVCECKLPGLLNAAIKEMSW